MTGGIVTCNGTLAAFSRPYLVYSDGRLLIVLYHDGRGLLHEQRFSRPWALEMDSDMEGQ